MKVTYIETKDGEIYLARGRKESGGMEPGVYSAYTSPNQIVFIYDQEIRQVWEEEYPDSLIDVLDENAPTLDMFQGNIIHKADKFEEIEVSDRNGNNYQKFTMGPGDSIAIDMTYSLELKLYAARASVIKSVSTDVQTAASYYFKPLDTRQYLKGSANNSSVASNTDTQSNYL